MNSTAKTFSKIGGIAAIILALIAVLTFSRSHVTSVDSRLSTRINTVETVQRRNHEVVLDKLMEQGEDIGEIKGMLGRIERKIDGGP